MNDKMFGLGLGNIFALFILFILFIVALKVSLVKYPIKGVSEVIQVV